MAGWLLAGFYCWLDSTEIDLPTESYSAQNFHKQIVLFSFVVSSD
eukprot:COSAG01_NODE_3339_length_6232_cov_10.685309_1_plen_45_part_00